MSAHTPSRFRDPDDDDPSSEYCPPKPETFQSPVTWLLGSSLLSHLGWIVLHSVLGRRLGGIDWMRPEPITREKDEHQARQAADPQASEEFWFDYIADSGDSQKATYNVAYLCLSDLFAEAAEPGAAVHLDQAPGRMKLPRGEFLFVGGDTAYHVANYRTLLLRFRNPFYWAYRELSEGGHDSARRLGRLYAIPGNHDYYDGLRGFNRQFRKPLEQPGLLSVPCFERVQEASYMALELPYDWWLFGMDMHSGELDRRQRVYFKRIIEKYSPKKLIVATAEPTTVLDRRTAESEPVVRTMRGDLSLSAPFADTKPHLPEGHCRLDLSGDVHQYARYWGPPEQQSYASVVSGLGGAFLHPTSTSFGQIKPNAKFPASDSARREANRRLFSVLPVLLGGNMLVLGSLLGAVLFGAWRSAGTNRLLDMLASGIERLVPGGALGSRHAFPVLAADTGSLFGNMAFWMLAIGLSSAVLAIWLLKRYASSVKQGEDPSRPYGAYLGFAVMGAAPLCAGLVGPPLPPASLTQSTVLFVFSVFAFVAIYAAIWHREILDERAKKQSAATKWFDDIFTLGMANSGFVAIAGAFWRYGDVRVSLIGFHWAFLILVVVGAIALILNGALVGAIWHPMRSRVGFGCLGLWHAVVQIGVPLLWARYGLSSAALLYIPLFAVMNLCGYWVGSLQSLRAARIGLVALWLITGIIGLLLPIYMPGSAGLDLWPHTLLLAVFAGLMSCAWFCWYLAVSLAFNGHNNEVGGAVRMEQFIEIMRVRLTPDTLTAYVIGVEKLDKDGKNLRPRLVDVFTLDRRKPEEIRPDQSAP